MPATSPRKERVDAIATVSILISVFATLAMEKLLLVLFLKRWGGSGEHTLESRSDVTEGA